MQFGSPSPENLGPQVLSLTLTFMLFGGVCFILKSRGPQVCASACLFVATLVSTQLAMSCLSNPPFSYKRPGFVTALHFFCVWFACIAYWYYQGDLNKCFPSSMNSRKRFVVTIGPIALCSALAVVFNNTALAHAGAGLCAIIGTLSPVVVAVVSRLLGRVLSPTSWLGVLTAFTGGMVIATSEMKGLALGGAATHHAVLGLCFALASVLARAMKVAVMDILLAPAEYQHVAEENLSPMHLYALQAPWCFLTAMLYSLATEDIPDAMRELASSTSGVAPLVAMTCVSAVILNLVGIFVLRDLGASSQQIVGKLNTICVASLSMGFFGEHLPRPVLQGSVIVLAGVAIFEYGVEHGSQPSTFKHKATDRRKVPYNSMST